METCICSYLPKLPIKKVDPLSESCNLSLSSDNVNVEENEIIIEVDCEKKSEESFIQSNDEYDLEISSEACKLNGREEVTSQELEYKSRTDRLNEKNENEFSTFASNVEVTASKILFIETKKWIIRKKLLQAESDVECLQQALNAQWTLRSRFCTSIQELKNKKEKLIQEIQKNFTKHFKKRNRLIQDITEVRQRILYITKTILLTESKNIELEIERQYTTDCLCKSMIENRSNSASTSKSVEGNYSATATESDTSISSRSTASLEPRSEKSLTPYSEIENGNTPSSSGTTTDIESEKSEQIDIEKDAEHDVASLKAESKMSDQICLDLSFLDNNGPNHLDSGFSEANNLASKNSAGDCSTSSGIDYANIFKSI